MDADVIVVGAGLAGLVATAELADAGKRVVVLEQEPEASLGGQAFWSLGGLFLVGTRQSSGGWASSDSHELAWQDWLGSAGFDRDEDHWPRRWAEAYVEFAAGEKRAWLHEQGLRMFPVIGWAERGDDERARARQLRAAVPRHVGHRAGPRRAVRAPRARGGRRAASSDCDSGIASTSCVDDRRRGDGVRGAVLEPSAVARGEPSSRAVVGEFELSARRRSIVTSGGIGGNHDLVRAAWPERLGTPPDAHGRRRPRLRRRADARRSSRPPAAR